MHFPLTELLQKFDLNSFNAFPNNSYGGNLWKFAFILPHSIELANNFHNFNFSNYRLECIQFKYFAASSTSWAKIGYAYKVSLMESRLEIFCSICELLRKHSGGWSHKFIISIHLCKLDEFEKKKFIHFSHLSEIFRRVVCLFIAGLSVTRLSIRRKVLKKCHNIRYQLFFW